MCYDSPFYVTSQNVMQSHVKEHTLGNQTVMVVAMLQYRHPVGPAHIVCLGAFLHSPETLGLL